jgi:nucleoid-associated protein YgaU
MRRSTIIILALVVLGFVAAALPAQSLLDNEYYKKAQALKAQSDTALAAGDYDTAASLAADAKDNFAKSDAYVEEMLGRYRANGWMQVGNDYLAKAKAAGSDTSAKELYDDAANDLAMAKAAYDGGTYLDSVDFSKRAIATLGTIPAATPVAVTPVQPVVTPVQPVVTPVQPVAVPTESVTLPATYTVRLIPERRDCLWRIAEYPFVYNDPWKWKVLYEANRDILIEPDNPDLIEVGQVLTIPSLTGEWREGEYDSTMSYPVFSAK